MDQKIKSDRLHGLDALRAIAMFLGVVLHASIAYKEVSLPTWPSDIGSKNYGWDYLYSFIHSFRMPMFYLIAGFFCNMLFKRVGNTTFIKNRVNRIVIPFICCLIILLPLTTFPFLLYKNLHITSWNYAEAFSMALPQLLKWNGMAHFWFLYYLIFYYAIFLVLIKLINYGFMVESFKKAKQSISNNPVWNMALITGSFFIVFILLLLNKALFFGVNTGVIPHPVNFAYYGLFFLIGNIIYLRSEYFIFLKKRNLLMLSVGFSLSIVTFYLEFIFPSFLNKTSSEVVMKLLFALQCVLLVNGFIGFFLKYFVKDSSTWRYFSDAAYWVYLLHLGLIAGLQLLLMKVSMNSAFKFIIVLLATTIICLITYHYLVRYTVIGRYLHGPRKKTLS